MRKVFGLDSKITWAVAFPHGKFYKVIPSEPSGFVSKVEPINSSFSSEEYVHAFGIGFN